MKFLCKKTGIGLFVLLVLVFSLILNGYIQNRMLFDAIENNDIIAAKKAVDHGAWVDTRKYLDIRPIVELVGNNPTPLNLACHIGNQEIVEYLINHGANINGKSRFTKDTPLLHALHGTKSNRFSLAMLLINSGANIYDEDQLASLGRKVLYISNEDNTKTISEGYELCKYLLENNVPLYISGNRESLLTFAAKYSSSRIIYLLLEDGRFDIDDYDPSYETALIVAVKNGKNEIVSMLVELGADTTLMDSHGKTALDYAKEANNSTIIALFESNN